MSDPTTATTTASLDALAARLRRLEHVLAGTVADPAGTLSSQDTTLRGRIAGLKRELARLQQKSQTVSEILSIHARNPEVFAITPTPPPTLGTAEKASTLLLSAPAYQETASQLTAISDTPIPDPKLSAELVKLLPRLQRAEATHAVQAAKVAVLRSRSAKVLEQWFLVGIEGVNECFAEWDERTFALEKEVARKARDWEY